MSWRESKNLPSSSYFSPLFHCSTRGCILYNNKRREEKMPSAELWVVGRTPKNTSKSCFHRSDNILNQQHRIYDWCLRSHILPKSVCAEKSKASFPMSKLSRRRVRCIAFRFGTSTHVVVSSSFLLFVWKSHIYFPADGLHNVGNLNVSLSSNFP